MIFSEETKNIRNSKWSLVCSLKIKLFQFRKEIMRSVHCSAKIKMWMLRYQSFCQVIDWLCFLYIKPSLVLRFESWTELISTEVVVILLLLLSSGMECEVQQHRLQDHLSWRRPRHPHLRLSHVMRDVLYRLQEKIFWDVFSNHWVVNLVREGGGGGGAVNVMDYFALAKYGQIKGLFLYLCFCFQFFEFRVYVLENIELFKSWNCRFNIFSFQIRKAIKFAALELIWL